MASNIIHNDDFDNITTIYYYSDHSSSYYYIGQGGQGAVDHRLEIRSRAATRIGEPEDRYLSMLGSRV